MGELVMQIMVYQHRETKPLDSYLFSGRNVYQLLRKVRWRKAGIITWFNFYKTWFKYVYIFKIEVYVFVLYMNEYHVYVHIDSMCVCMCVLCVLVYLSVKTSRKDVDVNICYLKGHWYVIWWRKKEERKEIGELKNKINSGLH